MMFYVLLFFLSFCVLVFVRAILSWCPLTWHIYIVYNILSLNISLIYITLICMPIVTGVTGWTQWSAWSECSSTCGTGLQERNRVCQNQIASSLNNSCDGGTRDTRTCAASSCKWQAPFIFYKWYGNMCGILYIRMHFC